MKVVVQLLKALKGKGNQGKFIAPACF